MSRLDSFIARLHAQRACLDRAAALVAGVPGPVLELGLGNGRTFDHLRERLAGREIYVFDRQVAAHPDSVPDPAHMIVGDFRETLGAARARRLAPAVLAHCDTGTGDVEASRALAAVIGPLLAPLLAPGAVVVSDQPIATGGWRALDLPENVAPGRYYMYQADGPGGDKGATGP